MNGTTYTTAHQAALHSACTVREYLRGGMSGRMPSTPNLSCRLDSEYQAALKALPPALKGKPRSKADEANLRAREALKGKPPNGAKRWSWRSLARAIGCSGGLIEKLPAWHAYADLHPECRRKDRPAPKAVSLSPGILADEGRDDEELERLKSQELERLQSLTQIVTEHVDEDRADRRRYRRRPKA